MSSSKPFTPTTKEELSAYVRSMKKSFVDACEQEGDANSCHSLAEFLEGMEKNYTEAMQQYKQNCEKNKHAGSCLGAGLLAYQGVGGPKDVAEGIRLFTKACAFNAADGCNNAGMAYKSKGEDKKPRDLRKAEKFFTKGCDAGDGRSCFNLSTLYLTGGLEDSKGNEIIQDMGKAFELSAKACDLGSKYGCVNAARMVMTTAVEGGDALAEEFQEKANVLHKKV